MNAAGHRIFPRGSRYPAIGSYTACGCGFRVYGPLDRKSLAVVFLHRREAHPSPVRA